MDLNLQYQKEHIKDAILKAAKDEFISKGYQKASIRHIAKNADLLPGNIYNYFKGKNEIFEEVLRPVIEKIEKAKLLIYEKELNFLPDDHPNLQEHHIEAGIAVDFIEDNWDLLKLLIFNSYGSTLEEYCDQIVEWYTDEWYLYLNKNNINKIDRFMLHNIAVAWYNLIREILMHDVRGERLKQVSLDMMTFLFHGYQNLLKQRS